MSEDKFLEPFSPTILERKVPQKFIDIVNRVGDEVLSDETKSREWDFSENLVGKVRKEVQIPIVDKAEKKYCLDYMKESCLLFLQEMLKKNRTYEWNKLTGVGTSQNLYPSLENIHPSSGLIQFMYGESQDFRSDTLTCLPEVGKMYLFPSWLKHSVYPFYCEGERRSLSFNAFFRK